MKSVAYHRAQVRIVPAARGFDVWYGAEFVGHRSSERGAQGLAQAHATACAAEDRRDADEARAMARDWLGRRESHAE